MAMDGIPRYEFPEGKPDTPPHKYYRRYKMWEFEISKLRNSKDFYVELSNIGADTARKRMESYSPSLVQTKRQRERKDDTANTSPLNTQRSGFSDLPGGHPSFITSPTTPFDRTFASTMTKRSAIDPKLTDTNNSVSPRSVYGYLKVNFVDNIVPPRLLDPSVVTRKFAIKREKEQHRVDSIVLKSNQNYERRQLLLKPIEQYKSHRPSYKFEKMMEKYKATQLPKPSRRLSHKRNTSLHFSKHTPIPESTLPLNSSKNN